MNWLHIITTILLNFLILAHTFDDDIEGHRHRLLFLPDIDPNADIDHFSALSKSDVHKYWDVSPEPGTFVEKLSRIRDLDILIHVSVILVGFNGDGRAHLMVSTQDLVNLLESATTPLPIHVRDANVDYAPANRLPTRTKYFFSVQHARKGLVKDIGQKIRDHVINNDTMAVPISLIDDIIQEDVQKQLPNSYLVYILNVRPPRSGQHAKSFYYVPDTGPVTRGCGLNSWAGNDRYAWMDMTALPSSIGPRSGPGDGVTSDMSVPRLSNYKGEGGPLVSELLAHLAVYISKTCRILLTPPMDHLPLPFAPPSRRIHVELVVVHDGTDESTDPDWDTIIKKVDDLHVDGGQSVTFGKQRVSLGQCRGCARAIALAMKGSVSPILRGGVSIQFRQFLDSLDLRQGFLRMLPVLIRSHDVHSVFVPVIVVSLSDSDVILLDGRHQVVPFGDMVVGIQTASGKLSLDQQCNLKSISADSRRIERPLLGAVLQSVWGVSPTHSLWSELHNKTVIDHLWSQSLTPFADFSTDLGISFSQRDSARRNVVLSHMSTYIKELNGTMGHFRSGQVDFDEYLSFSEKLDFDRRANVMRFKLKSCSHALSMHQYSDALWWVKSAHVDVKAIHELVHQVGARVQTHVECDRSSGASLWVVFLRIVSYVAVFAVLVLSLRRGVRLVSRKEKVN